MDYQTTIATSIAERLLNPSLTWDQYLTECKVAGKKVRGVTSEMMLEAATLAWVRIQDPLI